MHRLHMHWMQQPRQEEKWEDARAQHTHTHEHKAPDA